MTRYETSPEVRPLEKTICEFAGLNGYDPMNVFTDFLRYVIHGFSPGAPPLKDWRYKRQQNAAFMKMFAEWVRLMQKQLEAASWYDALGDLFMALSSRKGQQAQGQFFTPVHICDLMVMCTETDEKKTGQRINDPTCGSGRLLLAYHVRHLGNYLVAEDVNRTCCLMTICNMLIHGCVGEVIHHDSLCPENFMDGWMVNHTLTQTGIPSIRRMSEEEYRTSRNMSVDLLRKRKEKLARGRGSRIPHHGDGAHGHGSRTPHHGDGARGRGSRTPHHGDGARGRGSCIPHHGDGARGRDSRTPHHGDGARGRDVHGWHAPPPSDHPASYPSSQ